MYFPVSGSVSAHISVKHFMAGILNFTSLRYKLYVIYVFGGKFTANAIVYTRLHLIHINLVLEMRISQERLSIFRDSAFKPKKRDLQQKKCKIEHAFITSRRLEENYIFAESAFLFRPVSIRHKTEDKSTLTISTFINLLRAQNGAHVVYKKPHYKG